MQISREDAFDVWAPEASPWAVWAKPVLFSYLPPIIVADDAATAAPPPSVSAWASATAGAAIVVDLPGVQSVALGEALAHVGFRSILLFNAVPGPWEESPFDSELGYAPQSVVDVYPTIEAIAQATPRLRGCGLSSEAPPAFVLDAERRLGRERREGDFDNRSVSLPTDFPSAAFLQSRGVTQVIVVADAQNPLTADGEPATDLAHTLLRWQLAGIQILSVVVDEQLIASPPKTIRVARPSWFGAIWHNALSLVGLRRNPLGGFGGRLPVASSSG